MLLNILSAILIIISLIFCHPTSSQQPLSDCLNNQKCGDLNVSYPFRLRSRPECPSFSSYFELECNESSRQLYFNNDTSNVGNVTQLQVIENSNDSLIVDITGFRACDSYNYSSVIALPLFPGPYYISEDNKFGSFGCGISGSLSTATNIIVTNSSSHYDYSYDYYDYYADGCFVSCPNSEKNPDCGNQTCCVLSLFSPAGPFSRGVIYSVTDLTHYKKSTNSSCAQKYGIPFHPNYTDFDKEVYRLKLSWALPSNQTMSGIIQSSDYACSNNSNLTLVSGVPGYTCSCNPGYAGDGYSNGSSCSHVDECRDSSLNDCIPGSTTCHNLEGSYACKCDSPFYVGDGHLRNGSGCKFSPTLRNIFVSSAAILGFALFMGGFLFLAIWWRQRTKRKYFMKNGGLELQSYIAAGARETTKLFSAKELKVATNNYSDEMNPGVGGYGTVFKGTLEDGIVVAIKKANRGEDGDNEQFLNEMAILTQINHRHIVKLLGCCLETAVPLLVYEYVSNGNVEENLESDGPGVMGWGQRLKVGRQIVEALAYLHAAASPPILHRDVKPANVLLDDNLDAKVVDFGVSRIVPKGVLHVSTVVQGTLGYLDPEYFQMLQFTDKSDVYSLGVLLVQLITGLKPVDIHNREPCFANLSVLFIHHMREGRGEELIDPRLENPSTQPINAMWHTRSSIMAVATLATHCLASSGAERPSMSHVSDELRRINRSLEGADEDDEEAHPLLSSKQEYANYNAGAILAAHKSQYQIPCGSNSMSIDNQLLNVPTMPR